MLNSFGVKKDLTSTRSHYRGSQSHVCTQRRQDRWKARPLTTYPNRPSRSALYSPIRKKCDALLLGQTFMYKNVIIFKVHSRIVGSA